ncbi:unnamed protein product [Leptosia nina]|uniref:Uncharacterized protein n=1 Tax=Leptosia nina TaxID=320188 RepID=A0AAV1JAG5_9NEOP
MRNREGAITKNTFYDRTLPVSLSGSAEEKAASDNDANDAGTYQDNRAKDESSRLKAPQKLLHQGGTQGIQSIKMTSTDNRDEGHVKRFFPEFHCGFSLLLGGKRMSVVILRKDQLKDIRLQCVAPLRWPFTPVRSLRAIAFCIA